MSCGHLTVVLISKAARRLSHNCNRCRQFMVTLAVNTHPGGMSRKTLARVIIAREFRALITIQVETLIIPRYRRRIKSKPALISYVPATRRSRSFPPSFNLTLDKRRSPFRSIYDCYQERRTSACTHTNTSDLNYERSRRSSFGFAYLARGDNDAITRTTFTCLFIAGRGSRTIVSPAKQKHRARVRHATGTCKFSSKFRSS